MARNRPIRVGIITMPHEDGPRSNESHIMSPYLDWHTSRGIQPVPIPYDTKRPQWYFERVDGIIIPGGGAKANLKLFSTAWAFIQYSISQWKSSKSPFPVWGTCLGFEIILMLIGGIFPLKKYDAKNARYPLKWTRATHESRMWTGPQMTAEYLKQLSTNPSALNNHTWGISPQKFRANPYLNNLFLITSTSLDDKKAEFVESFEGRKGLPIYGVQWHPERQPNEMGPLLDFWASEIYSAAVRRSLKPLGKTYDIHPRKGKCTQYQEHSHLDCIFIADGSDYGGSVDGADAPLFIKRLLGHWATNFRENLDK